MVFLCEGSIHIFLLEPGYRGDTCQESFHICDGEGSPCLNGGKCVPTPGGTFLDYTCECVVGKIFLSFSQNTPDACMSYNSGL